MVQLGALWAGAQKWMNFLAISFFPYVLIPYVLFYISRCFDHLWRLLILNEPCLPESSQIARDSKQIVFSTPFICKVTNPKLIYPANFFSSFKDSGSLALNHPRGKYWRTARDHSYSPRFVKFLNYPVLNFFKFACLDSCIPSHGSHN